MRSRINRLLLLSSSLAFASSTSLILAQEPSGATPDGSEASIAATKVATPAQQPPKKPHVTCDGDLLTINADNSTLAGVLEAVRECTGAQFDVSERLAGERLFAAFGPGPVRQVLGALLSSTDFDYVIQSSASDPQKIQTVLVIARTTKDSTTTTAAAGASPARRTWQQARNIADSSSTSSEELSEVTSATEPANASSSEAATTTPAPETPSSNSQIQPAAAGGRITPALSESSAIPNQSNGTQQLIQDMRRMFEERRQQVEQQKSSPAHF
jgi:hypothetical protein